jgi:hypothetical protein
MGRMNATGLPSDDFAFDVNPDDQFSTRTRRVEFLMLSLVSLIATMTVISIFGTHVNTWLGTISVTVAGR